MPRFKDYNYDQQIMLAIDFRQQILPGSFEWAIDHIVDNKLNLSVFDQRYNNDATGAPAYDPAIMLKIILFAYARGILSSRQIAQACKENIVFMALSADSQPHFTSIASFIAKMSKEIQPLFTDVLMYCDQLELIQGDMFAVDGCKLPSNAGKQHSGTHAELKHRREKLAAQSKRLLEVHATADQEEQGTSSQEQLQLKLDELNQSIEKIDVFLSKEQERKGPSGKVVKSNTTDNESAKMNTSHGVLQGYNGLAAVDAGSQVVVHAEAIGQGPENDRLMPMLDGLKEQLEAIGHKDIFETSTVTADSGFHSTSTLKQLEDHNIDAYVADTKMRERDQAFDDRDKHKTKHREERQRQAKQNGTAQPSIYTVDDFTYDPDKKTCHCPAGQKLYSNGSNTVSNNYPTHKFKGSKSICEPCSHREKCLQNPEKTKVKQIGFRISDIPVVTDTPLTRMKDKIDAPEGRRIYSKRLGTVEPVFGNHRNHGRDQFTLRGQKKVNAQWKLYNLVHNIGKCQRSGRMAA